VEKELAALKTRGAAADAGTPTRITGAPSPHGSLTGSPSDAASAAEGDRMAKMTDLVDELEELLVKLGLSSLQNDDCIRNDDMNIFLGKEAWGDEVEARLAVDQATTSATAEHPQLFQDAEMNNASSSSREENHNVRETEIKIELEPVDVNIESIATYNEDYSIADATADVTGDTSASVAEQFYYFDESVQVFYFWNGFEWLSVEVSYFAEKLVSFFNNNDTININQQLTGAHLYSITYSYIV